MKEILGGYLEGIWGLISIIFFLPFLVLTTIYIFFKIYILGENIEYKNNEKPSKLGAVISLIIWGLIVAPVIYSTLFDYIQYVYAFPDYINSSKSYHLVADVSHDDGYTSVDKIYFPNSGYLTFEYCEVNEENSKMLDCYTEDDRKRWVIDFAETVKVRKY